MHSESQTTVTTTATEAAALESAIAQAVLQHQQEQEEQAATAQAERQAAEQKAIARFQLPFDPATLNALPTIAFRFEGETSDLKTIGWFQYQDMEITVSQSCRG